MGENFICVQDVKDVGRGLPWSPSTCMLSCQQLLQHLFEKANIALGEGSSLWLRMQSTWHTINVCKIPLEKEFDVLTCIRHLAEDYRYAFRLHVLFPSLPCLSLWIVFPWDLHNLKTSRCISVRIATVQLKCSWVILFFLVLHGVFELSLFSPTSNSGKQECLENLWNSLGQGLPNSQ